VWNAHNTVLGEESYILKNPKRLSVCVRSATVSASINPLPSDRLRCCDRYIRCQRSLAVKPLTHVHRRRTSAGISLLRRAGGGVGLWTLTCTPSLCLQLHYSVLRVGRRELRRCITFGNYHVNPQSGKRDCGLSYTKFALSLSVDSVGCRACYNGRLLTRPDRCWLRSKQATAATVMPPP